jgi:ABC-type nitrate/sulfonate/bicarbonate transport system permease component
MTMSSGIKARASSVLPILVCGALWEAVSRSGLVDPAFVPSLLAIGHALADLLTGPEIRSNLGVTLWRTACGLSLGAIFGVAMGAGMARSVVFRAYVSPLIGATYSLPKSALVPLFILWFGVGSTTSIAAIFLACLLPMVVHTEHGVSSTPHVLVWSGEALGTSAREMLLRVYLRHALPDILTGFRIALGFAFVIAVSSEMIASTSGIGKLIFMYGENGSYDYMLAAISCVVVIAFLVDRCVLAASRRVLRWHDSAADGSVA